MPDPNNDIIICETTRLMFYYSFLWPGRNEDLEPGLAYKIRVVLHFLMAKSLFLLAIVHMIVTIKDHPNENFAEEMAAVIASAGAISMGLAFVTKQKQLALLLNDLSKFESFGKPAGFDSKCKQMNFFMKTVTFVSMGVITFHSFRRVFEKSNCQKYNQERGLDSKYCGLITPLWLPFNIDYFPLFEICFVYVYVVVNMFMKNPLFLSFFAFEIVQHIILRLKKLETMILECFEENSLEKFRNCVLYHQEILDFAKRLDDIFFNSMFGHLALTGSICACIEKQVVDGINVFDGILHVSGWILALFLACVGGQNLLDSNDIVTQGLEEAKWYQVDHRLKTSYHIMLLRSQKIFYLRAGPFGILSYALFVSVLKMSYSILTMLTA